MRGVFDPLVGKIPWRRAWKPTPVFLLGESHRQRNLAGYSPQGWKELDMTEVTEHTHTHTHRDIYIIPLSIHLLMDTGCFHTLAIVNNADYFSLKFFCVILDCSSSVKIKMLEIFSFFSIQIKSCLFEGVVSHLQIASNIYIQSNIPHL